VAERWWEDVSSWRRLEETQPGFTDWANRYKAEHGYYPGSGNNDESLQEALSNRSWGDAVFATTGRAPTRQEWVRHYYRPDDEELPVRDTGQWWRQAAEVVASASEAVADKQLDTERSALWQQMVASLTPAQGMALGILPSEGWKIGQGTAPAAIPGRNLPQTYPGEPMDVVPNVAPLPSGLPQTYPGEPDTAGARGSYPGAPLVPLLLAAAAAQGVGAYFPILQAIVDQESGWDPSRVNDTSMATGLMQVMPSDVSDRYGGAFDNRPSSAELLDPATNIAAGVADFVAKLNGADGDLARALTNYSGGYPTDVYAQPVIDRATAVYGYGTGTPGRSVYDLYNLGAPREYRGAGRLPQTYPGEMERPDAQQMSGFRVLTDPRGGTQRVGAPPELLAANDAAMRGVLGSPETEPYRRALGDYPTRAPVPMPTTRDMARGVSPQDAATYEQALWQRASQQVSAEQANRDPIREWIQQRLGISAGSGVDLGALGANAGAALAATERAIYDVRRRLFGEQVANALASAERVPLGSIAETLAGVPRGVEALAQLPPAEAALKVLGQGGLTVGQAYGTWKLASMSPERRQSLSELQDWRIQLDQLRASGQGDTPQAMALESRIAERQGQMLEEDRTAALGAYSPEAQAISAQRAAETGEVDLARAWEAGRAGSYSGDALLSNAYNRIAEGEDPEAVLAQLTQYQNPLLEALGQSILDPLNIVGVVGNAIGKAVRISNARWYVRAFTGSADDALARVTAAALPESGIGKAGAYLNLLRPTRGMRQERLLNDSNNVTRLLLMGVSDEGEAAQRIALWMTNPDLAARTYNLDVLASEPGKRAAGLLGRMGDADAFNAIARTARTQAMEDLAKRGVTGQAATQAANEAVVEAMLRHAQDTLDEVVPQFRTAYEHAAVPMETVRRAKLIGNNSIDDILHTAFMGWNPGYAWRNAAGNLTPGITDGLLFPFETPAAREAYQARFGVKPRRAAVGVGTAGSRPEHARDVVSRFNQRIESAFSEMYTHRGVTDTMARLWPESVNQQLGDLAPLLTRDQSRSLTVDLMGAVNENEIRAAFRRARRAVGQSLDPDLMAQLGRVDAGMRDAIARIHRESPDFATFQRRIRSEVLNRVEDFERRTGQAANLVPQGHPVAADAEAVSESWAQAVIGEPREATPVNPRVVTSLPSEEPDLQAAMARYQAGREPVGFSAMHRADAVAQGAPEQAPAPQVARAEAAVEAPTPAAVQAPTVTAEPFTVPNVEDLTPRQRRQLTEINARIQADMEARLGIVQSSEWQALPPDEQMRRWQLHSQIRGQGYQTAQQLHDMQADYRTMSDHWARVFRDAQDALRGGGEGAPLAVPIEPRPRPPADTGARVATEAPAAQRGHASVTEVVRPRPEEVATNVPPDLRAEFAQAARDAGFTANPDGSFNAGAEVHMANALRAAGVPIDGRVVRVGDLSEEQLRSAIDVLHQRAAAAPEVARAEAATVAGAAPEAATTTQGGTYRAERYPGGLSATSAFQGGPVYPEDGYAWRSMGPKEYEAIASGQPFGSEAGGARKGAYWSWYPGYSADIVGTRARPKYLVEVRGQWADETLVGTYTAADITGVWKHEGGEWVRQPLPTERAAATAAPQVARAEAAVQEVVRLAPADVDAAGRQQANSYPVAEIGIDPDRFQYKMVHGATGSTGSLTGVQAWDPNLAQGVMLWRDPADGRVWVVNGHNRVALAQRLGVDQLPNPYFIEVATAEEARAVGALANIVNGRGNAIDAAKFFRDSGLSAEDLAARGISFSERLVQDGVALASLNDLLFNAVSKGEFPLERAIIIGRKLPNHAQQTELLRMIQGYLDKGRVINNDVVAELCDMVAGVQMEATQQATLFGTEVLQRGNALERAEVQAYVRAQLGRDKRLFGTVASNADALARAGNVIDQAASRGISSDAGQALAIFDVVKNQQGEIGAIISEGAARIAKGEARATVEREVYERIREALPRVIRGEQGPRAAGVGQGALFGEAIPGPAAGQPAATPGGLGTGQQPGLLGEQTRPPQGRLGAFLADQGGEMRLTPELRSFDEFMAWEFPTPQGGATPSMTPKQALSLPRDEYETLYDLAQQGDGFRLDEALGKGYDYGGTVRPSLSLREAARNDTPITVYRASDTGDILPGSYVTESRQYAATHAEANIRGPYTMYEMQVKPSELMTYGDPHEFIYIPENPQVAYQRYVSRARQGTVAGIPDQIRRLLGDETGALTIGRPYASETTQELRGLTQRILDDARTTWGRGGALEPARRRAANQALDTAQQRAIRELNTAKTIAVRVGEATRDFALHDYSARRAIDVLAGAYLLYPYWSMRSYPKWAARIAMNPGIAASYLRYKKALHEINADLPEGWWREQLWVTLPGMSQPIALNLEHALNPMVGLMENWDDPEQRKTWLGRAISAVDEVGLSAHPLFAWGYAADRALQGDTEGAMSRAGYVSSVSRFVKYATGMIGLNEGRGITLEPWLWRGRPWTGGDVYEWARVARNLGILESQGTDANLTRYAAHYMGTGELPEDPELARSVVATLDDAMRMEVGNKGWSTAIGFLFGAAVKPRNVDDLALSRAQEELAAIYDKADSMDEDQWHDAINQFYATYPWMRTVAMGRKTGDRAVASWSWEVYNRLPPGKQSVRDQYILGDPEKTGVTQEFLDNFRRYKGFRDGDGNFWASGREMELWQARMMDLAAQYGVPASGLTAEWQRVYDSRREMYGAMDSQFPGWGNLESRYWALKATDPQAASAYLELNPSLSQAWAFKDQWAKDHPEYAWYYADAPREQTASVIWEVWNALEKGGLDRRNVRQRLGPDFEAYFLDADTRNLDAVSNAQLLGWLAALGAMAAELGIDDSVMRSLWTEAPGTQTAAPTADPYASVSERMGEPEPVGVPTDAVVPGGGPAGGSGVQVQPGDDATGSGGPPLQPGTGTDQQAQLGGAPTGVATGGDEESPLQLADAESNALWVAYKEDAAACNEDGDEAACQRLNRREYDQFRGPSSRPWRLYYDSIAPGWRTQDSGFYDDPLISRWMDPATRDSVDVNDVVARINELRAALPGARFGDPAEYEQARAEQDLWLEQAQSLMPRTMDYRRARLAFAESHQTWAKYYLRPAEQESLQSYAASGFQYPARSGGGGGGGGGGGARYRYNGRKFYVTKRRHNIPTVKVTKSTAWYKLVNGGR
jgi:hypothetical protein